MVKLKYKGRRAPLTITNPNLEKPCEIKAGDDGIPVCSVSEKDAIFLTTENPCMFDIVGLISPEAVYSNAGMDDDDDTGEEKGDAPAGKIDLPAEVSEQGEAIDFSAMSRKNLKAMIDQDPRFHSIAIPQGATKAELCELIEKHITAPSGE